MAENTAIEWCDHTFNPWVGCTKVSPACDHCYAEAWAKRSGSVQWGGERRRTTPANWRKPLQWQANAAEFMATHGRRQRVFCASLADVFDNQVPVQWRADLLRWIDCTPDLDWLLLTKRIGNVEPMLKDICRAVDGTRAFDLWPRPNVWLGATLVNREEMLRDAPKLMAMNAAVRFWSVEPMLGDFGEIPRELMPDWVICGGESGPGARPIHPDWARSLRDQCAAAGVPFFFKQWGEWTPGENVKARSGTVPTAEWFNQQWDFYREDLACDPYHVDYEPDLYRVGKKAAGRLLDGIEHNGYPLTCTKSQTAIDGNPGASTGQCEAQQEIQ